MSFTDEELAYIRSQPLARVATVSSDGQPDVVPVGFDSGVKVDSVDPGSGLCIKCDTLFMDREKGNAGA